MRDGCINRLQTAVLLFQIITTKKFIILLCLRRFFTFLPARLTLLQFEKLPYTYGTEILNHALSDRATQVDQSHLFSVKTTN